MAQLSPSAKAKMMSKLPSLGAVVGPPKKKGGPMRSAAKNRIASMVKKYGGK